MTTSLDTALSRVIALTNQLSPSERLELIGRLLLNLSQTATPDSATPRKWMDLAGVGHDVWAEMDAQAYIDRERAAWEG